jgi:hypothetical protein
MFTLDVKLPRALPVNAGKKARDVYQRKIFNILNTIEDAIVKLETISLKVEEKLYR